MQSNNFFYFIPDNKAQRYVERNIKEERYQKEIQLQFEPFSQNIINKLDLEGFKNDLEDIKKKMNGKVRSGADRLLCHRILEFIEIPNGIAAEGGFWNGISILDNEIYNFILWRWNYDNENIFRKTVEDQEYKRAHIIRFITSSTYSRLRKHTLARVWWSAKIIPEEYLDLFWYQQDTADRFLEKPFGAFNKNGETSQLVKKFLKIYQRKHKKGKFDHQREDKIRDILIWLRVLEEKVYLSNLLEFELNEMIDDIFRTVINEYNSF
jgi:hypothetical protein